MSDANCRKDIREAVRAGEDARNCLKQAKKCLDSAGNWGIVDLLGGGIITTWMKRSRMNEADELVQQARGALKRFQKELMFVENIPEFRIKTGDFLTFADYFFDGIVADWLVQSKINDARQQVEDAIEKVDYIMNLLGSM